MTTLITGTSKTLETHEVNQEKTKKLEITKFRIADKKSEQNLSFETMKFAFIEPSEASLIPQYLHATGLESVTLNAE